MNYVVGNWKMNHGRQDIEKFFNELPGEGFKCQAWIAPQAIHTGLCQNLGSKKNIQIGTQDCSAETNGAFTGELSPYSVRDIGLFFTLTGHSERRQHHRETSAQCQKKNQAALNAGIKVIYCLGETLEQREAGKTLEIVKEQLEAGLKGIEGDNNLLIAYEPVWAIGTGKVATPEQASEVHQFIKSWLLENSFGDLPVLYGGSVKPGNFADLLSQKGIDGGLVGGASLEASNYGELCRIAQEN